MGAEEGADQLRVKNGVNNARNFTNLLWQDRSSRDQSTVLRQKLYSHGPDVLDSFARLIRAHLTMALVTCTDILCSEYP